MKKVLALFLIIGIILCILLYFGGKYPDKIREYLMPEKPNGEILNDYQEITEEEAMAYINENLFVIKILNQQNESVLDVHNYITETDNKIKLFILASGSTFTKEELEEKAFNTFGFAGSITHEDVICLEDNTILYNYDNLTNTYTYNEEHEGHGGDTEFIYNHFIDIKEENNNYVLNVTRFYADDLMGGVDSKAYSNYTDYTNKTSNYLFDADEIYGNELYDNYEQNFINQFEQNYSTFIDKLVTYKFTMRKENDKITILSYEIIK